MCLFIIVFFFLFSFTIAFDHSRTTLHIFRVMIIFMFHFNTQHLSTHFFLIFYNFFFHFFVTVLFFISELHNGSNFILKCEYHSKHRIIENVCTVYDTCCCCKCRHRLWCRLMLNDVMNLRLRFIYTGNPLDIIS